MLGFFSASFFALLLSVSLSSVPSPLVIMILTIPLLSSLISCFSPFGGYAFVSLFSSLDSLGVLLSGLSSWITALMLLVSLSYFFRYSFPFSFVSVCLVLLLVVSLFFSTDNMLLFYLFFEASLFPTLLLIIKWGYQPERLQASLYFIMYTVCASLPLLFAIIYFFHASSSLYLVCFSPLWASFFSLSPSYVFSLAWLFAFLVKVPMWGVHLWLPKAHVEAPVSGSMVLAGILLKLGGYGLLKVVYSFSFFPSGIVDLILSINFWGLLGVSLICLCSSDIKVLIAYSSIVHMGMMVVGVLSGSVVGAAGAGLMMLAHGFSSPGLFSAANFNYEVVGSRHLSFSKGVGLLYPISGLIWFILLASNMAAPPSMSLVSEIMICISGLKLGVYLSVVLGGATFLSAAYNLYLYSVQQGDVGLGILPGGHMTSSFVLSSFLHFFPAYLCTLGVFTLL